MRQPGTHPTTTTTSASRRRRLASAGLLTLCAAAIVPPAADAATVSIIDGRATYRAAPGETNQVQVNDTETLDNYASLIYGGLYFRDLKATLRAGAGCKQLEAKVVQCGTALNRPILATLGDGNDLWAQFVPNTSDLQVRGEAGNDELDAAYPDRQAGKVSFDGGAGNDALAGSSKTALTLIGGTGNDTLDAYPDAASTIDAGDGGDTVRFHGFFTHVTPSIKLGAGDDLLAIGAAEFDRAVTTAYGSAFAWRSPLSAIDGAAGRDTLRIETASWAGYGPEPVVAPGRITVDLASAKTAVEVVDANTSAPDPNNEDGSIFQGPAVLLGSAAAETLIGGAGKDVIVPRGGVDFASGNGGDDRIDTRDGEVDQLKCGAGNDTVQKDAKDVADSTC